MSNNILNDKHSQSKDESPKSTSQMYQQLEDRRPDSKVKEKLMMKS